MPIRLRHILVEIISALLILLFVYTGINKLTEGVQFRRVLSVSPLIGSMARIISWLLPIGELSIALLLFFPALRKWGLLASLVLMTVFTLYINYMIFFTPARPCSCGGVLRQMTWKQHLAFNIFFTFLAATGLGLTKNPNLYRDKQE